MTLPHRAWGNANEARTKLRYTWHEFFKRFDVLLTPVAATAAFPHNHNPNRDERTVSVNGKSAQYAEQLFFAGLASLSYLPATAAPIGLTAEGLPVGLQIIGPEGEDSTTIEFARLLAREIAASCRRRHTSDAAFAADRSEAEQPRDRAGRPARGGYWL